MTGSCWNDYHPTWSSNVLLCLSIHWNKLCNCSPSTALKYTPMHVSEIINWYFPYFLLMCYHWMMVQSCHYRLEVGRRHPISLLRAKVENHLTSESWDYQYWTKLSWFRGYCRANLTSGAEQFAAVVIWLMPSSLFELEPGAAHAHLLASLWSWPFEYSLIWCRVAAWCCQALAN